MFLTFGLCNVFALFCSFASAQTIPADFHAWFDAQIVGKPANQFVLESLNLPCVGAAITPPSGAGFKSKIWDPQTKLWTRVIEGDPIRGGSWTWVITDQGPPPTITAADVASCGTNPPQTSTPTSGNTNPGVVPAVDLAPLASQLHSIIAGQQQDREARERIFANETQQIQTLSAQLKAHDEKTSTLVALFSNRYVQLILATVGTYLTTRQMIQ